ncbi:hypothetical protein HK100_006750 [Physocladia obscura]|uniref:PARP catalytic domain-containing protein n=1 Tax=Physocladia obscura TaxID=109957 RepID=A0AAD5SQ29_9FUNG|nr:hypothetical protein HK100_006750 [Physocladia obscura]
MQINATIQAQAMQRTQLMYAAQQIQMAQVLSHPPQYLASPPRSPRNNRNIYAMAAREERRQFSQWTGASYVYLYHQTSPEAARAIVRSQKMTRGSAGIVGGGIYFADSPAATERKAHSHGVILKARVWMGRMAVMFVGLNHHSVTYTELENNGFDSIVLQGLASGPEYIVYNYENVDNISVCKSHYSDSDDDD